MVLRAGQRYRSGSNVPRDMVKAGEFFRKAIEKNRKHGNRKPVAHVCARCRSVKIACIFPADPNAYFYLADMHSKGDGVEKDEQQAFELLRAATTYGIPEAQHNVAVRYIEGLGCEKDNAMAISYLEMAAMQGYQPSMVSVEAQAPGVINLAKHYSEGAIVDFDEGKARHLFQSVVDREPPFSPFCVAAQDGLKHLEALKDSGAAPARSLSKKMRGGGSLCVMM
ncbi:MAG: hypothetical protein BJ554DRAFT_5089 [Olpidium bornovanus]|uniref:Uncharacterized protein n=1 Tax=Olpidium bornovanus TaxID=278681 RepID=A0A8H8DDR3_9FUNG|nr:MAG: hypothetical protein BJ554DRAFT_5089 [Olpidium bornovanus]